MTPDIYTPTCIRCHSMNRPIRMPSRLCSRCAEVADAEEMSRRRHIRRLIDNGERLASDFADEEWLQGGP
jgi:hypothetical protein